MRKLLAYCFSIATIIFISHAEALSCVCVDMGDSLEAKVVGWSKASAAVFSGKVVKREEIEGTIDVVYTFAVDEVWKGSKDPVIEIRVTRSSCGLEFKLKTTYLIYAFKSSGLLQSGACTGVAAVDEEWAKQQIKFLGKGKPPGKEANPAKDSSN